MATAREHSRKWQIGTPGLTSEIGIKEDKRKLRFSRKIFLTNFVEYTKTKMSTISILARAARCCCFFERTIHKK